MSLADDINSLVKTKKIKKSLPGLPPANEQASVRGGSGTGIKNTGDIVWPAILEVTLETTAEMQARPDAGKIYQNNDNTSPNWVEVKRAKTLKLIDSNENEFEITEMIIIEP